MATPSRATLAIDPRPIVDVLSTNRIERLPRRPEVALHFTPSHVEEGETNTLGMQLHAPSAVPGYLLRALNIPALEVASIAKVLAVGFALAGTQKTAAEIQEIATQMVGALDNAMTSTAEKLKNDILARWDELWEDFGTAMASYQEQLDAYDPEEEEATPPVEPASPQLSQLEAEFQVIIEGNHPFTPGG